jgi:hypothetical protein
MGAESDAAVFFEVPNALFMLERNSFWDIMYDHRFYFTPFSLSDLFERAGFQPIAVRTRFQDQYVTLDAAARGPHSSVNIVGEEHAIDSMICSLPENLKLKRSYRSVQPIRAIRELREEE